jgi:hypothetical protein
VPLLGTHNVAAHPTGTRSQDLNPANAPANIQALDYAKNHTAPANVRALNSAPAIAQALNRTPVPPQNAVFHRVPPQNAVFYRANPPTTPKPCPTITT